ncbi:MAG: hypothetical protein J0I07_02340 [Myxococcales bacterium]|nr:hypothetical protein [Myxococcales bacterium]
MSDFSGSWCRDLEEIDLRDEALAAAAQVGTAPEDGVHSGGSAIIASAMENVELGPDRLGPWREDAQSGTRRRVILSLGLALLANIGCGPQAYVRDRAERDLRRRAAFETNCPADQLTLTPLSSEMALENGARDPVLGGTTTRETDAPRTMGVSGCGKRGTYIYVAGKGYVLNSSTEEVHTGSQSGSAGNALRPGVIAPTAPSPSMPPPAGMQ